ncbi:hypothetical protein VNO77_20469 [Canavalia gladiata]|uniref:Uncharacterized protein n=2 Tax=Canavalia gladiata TaxID=3824 RepID=A0AAN9QJD7_CANGL
MGLGGSRNVPTARPSAWFGSFTFSGRMVLNRGQLSLLLQDRSTFSLMTCDNVDNNSANGIQQVEPLGRFRCNQPNERNGLRRLLMPRNPIEGQSYTSPSCSSPFCIGCPGNRSIYRTRFMTLSKAEVVSNMI